MAIERAAQAASPAALSVHAAQTLVAVLQMGAVAAVQSPLSRQSTHAPAAVSQTSPPVQRLLTRALHWPHWPLLWHAGVVLERPAQAVSPPALLVHATHW